MRNFVISDIHGNNEKFRKALKHVKLKKTDNLYILGDFIDRGYDSKGVLDTVLLLIDNGFNVICIKGNHEQLFLDAYTDNSKVNNWVLNGGKETLSSFLTSSIEKIPIKYFEFINSFINYHEYDNYILVHAALNMLIENPFSDTHTMLWSRNQKELVNNDWLNGRKIIHGHNPTISSEIAESIKKSDIICIDNGSYFERPGYGNICILQLENLEVEFI